MVSLTDITKENTNKTTNTIQSNKESLLLTFYYNTSSIQTKKKDTLTTFYPTNLWLEHLAKYYLNLSLGL
jgi:hypothetical protein